MKYKIFVDGQEGTTGLQIHERLADRSDLEFLTIDKAKRKDITERERLLNDADIVFLCLPDDAAKESVSLIKNEKTRVIDASTAHRTNDDWVYGLPELSSQQREAIRTSKRVSNPGCYATGFNLILHPLVKQGIIPIDYPITCHAISGYSGGGKKLIDLYENNNEFSEAMKSPQLYALNLAHKHVPEMKKISGLDFAPIFNPIVSGFYKGMTVSVPIHARLLNKKLSAKELHDLMLLNYKDELFVKVMPFGYESNFANGFMGATECNNTNKAEIYVFGNEEQILLVSRLDNLGKGASGAAIQNMNIMLNFDEAKGL